MTKITNGVIKESYNFCMDGEKFRGSNTYNCKVVKYWGKTKNFLPKEVVCEDNIHYRETTKNGWRRYNKDRKTKFQSKNYTGTIITFFPNINKEQLFTKQITV